MGILAGLDQSYSSSISIKACLVTGSNSGVFCETWCFNVVVPVRRKILSILDSIDFRQESTEELHLDFFDRIQIEQVICKCEHKNQQGQTVCNVKVIESELASCGYMSHSSSYPLDLCCALCHSWVHGSFQQSLIDPISPYFYNSHSYAHLHFCTAFRQLPTLTW